LNNKKSVSIVIPNYNGKTLLQAYLPSTLAAIKQANTLYEIIIVDDCSKDDSVHFIRTNYPDIKLVINSANKGFSHTCNKGINASVNELILLLNSDVKLSPDYFEHQWSYFEREDTFGVMGRIIDMGGHHIQDAARMPKFNGLKLKTDYFYYNRSYADAYTYYLSGANALINAAKLKQIGGFFELFSPFYYEDAELGVRAWRLQWKCYYEHRAVCEHQISATTKNYDTRQRIKSIYFRNRYYMHALHLNGVALVLWYLQISLFDFLPQILIGRFWIWTSYKELFSNHQLIKQYRHLVRKLMEQHNSKQSLFNVMAFIKKSADEGELVKVNSAIITFNNE
jgi:GT2 family glycosyltransferase